MRDPRDGFEPWVGVLSAENSGEGRGRDSGVESNDAVLPPGAVDGITETFAPRLIHACPSVSITSSKDSRTVTVSPLTARVISEASFTKSLLDGMFGKGKKFRGQLPGQKERLRRQSVRLLFLIASP